MRSNLRCAFFYTTFNPKRTLELLGFFALFLSGFLSLNEGVMQA